MIRLSDQIFTSLNLPLDSRLSNIVIEGSNIKVESLLQYLQRVDINSRAIGMEVEISSPAGIYSISSFLNSIRNGDINSTKYKFNNNIKNEGFLPFYNGSGHSIKTDDESFPNRSNLLLKGFSVIDNQAEDSTELEVVTQEDIIVSGIGIMGGLTDNALIPAGTSLDTFIRILVQKNSGLILTAPTLSKGSYSGVQTININNPNTLVTNTTIEFQVNRNSPNIWETLDILSSDTTFYNYLMASLDSFSYRARVIGNGAVSPWSSMLNISISQITSLITPVLSVTNINNQLVSLQWTDLNTFPNEVNFELQDSPDGINSFQLTGIINLGTTNYTHTHSSVGIRYYRIRAKGNNTNSLDSSWSNVISAASFGQPLVVLEELTSITSSSATIIGYAQNLQGHTVLNYGFVYNTSINPTLSNNILSVNGPITEFGINSNAFSPNTTYYVKAYITTNRGTYYSTENQFDTLYTIPLPVVTTQAINSSGHSTAVFNGKIVSGDSLGNYGFVYSTSPNPTSADLNVNGSAINEAGDYSGTAINILMGTNYYVRAYASNIVGIAYGNEIMFNLDNYLSLPTLTTQAATLVTDSTAVMNGTLITDGGERVLVRGFVYGTTPNPTLSDNVILSQGDSLIAYTVDLIGISSNTTFYVRAFATNSVGTGYGNSISFTTNIAASNMSIETIPALLLADNEVIFRLNVINLGEGSSTTTGIVYSGEFINPVLGTHLSIETTAVIGESYVDITLVEGNTYHYRAYITDGINTYYGEEYSILVISILGTIPIVTTQAASLVTTNSSRLHGNIIGGNNLIVKGFVYGTTPNPTLSNIVVNSVNLGTNIFSVDLTGLTPGVTYYVRSYVTNSVGTGYGNSISFTTTAVLANVEVITNPVSNIGASEVVISWTINSIGAYQPADLITGYCYNNIPNPTILNSGGSNIYNSLETYSLIQIGLTPETTYYVKSYIKNITGDIFYGEEVNFTTSAAGTVILPTIGIADLNPFIDTINSITLTGFLLSNGGENLSAQGFVIGTTINPTTSNSVVHSANLVSDIWSKEVTNLLLGTNYYIRAFATNSAGTVYTRNITFPIELSPEFLSYYGSMMTRPTTGSQIATLTSTEDSTFTLNTGSTNLYHIVAIPDAKTLVSVIDQDPFPIPLNNNYELSSINTIDGAPYKVYILQIALPYSSNHRHNITLS